VFGLCILDTIDPFALGLVEQRGIVQ